MTDDPSKPRPRMTVCLPPGGSMSARGIEAVAFALFQGTTVSMFRQSGDQLAGVISRDTLVDDPPALGRREWSGSLDVTFEDEAGLRRMLDRARFDALDDGTDTVAMPRRTFDALRTMKRKREPKPLVQLPMTRQQRRYLARKGRTND